MEQFFVKVNGDFYTPKNKLHSSIKNLFRKKDGVLIESHEHKESFIQSIKESIEEINQKYPRCKAIDPYIYTDSDLRKEDVIDHSTIIQISGVSSLIIYKVREIYKP